MMNARRTLGAAMDEPRSTGLMGQREGPQNSNGSEDAVTHGVPPLDYAPNCPLASRADRRDRLAQRRAPNLANTYSLGLRRAHHKRAAAAPPTRAPISPRAPIGQMSEESAAARAPSTLRRWCPL